MRQVIRLVVVCALMVAAFSLVSTHPAHAACIVGDASDGNTLQAQVFASHSYTLNGFHTDGSFVFSVPEPFVSDILFTIPVPFGFRYTLVDNSINCGGTAFFNPGDSRANPLPGDRVAVYCNTAASPSTLDVWGVTDDSQGHHLFTFRISDLLSAGSQGISKKVEPLGTVVASLDGNGNFTAQWFGGPASATGQGDFFKQGQCSLPTPH